MKIRFTRLAHQDIQEVYEYISQESHQAAQSVLDHIEKAIDQLIIHPKIGRLGRVTKTRELIVAGLPFIVVYSTSDKFVDIVSIMHTSRRWPDRFE